jgi:hypothetical protein
MRAPDSFQPNILHVSVTKNAGTFTSWNAATPFGGSASHFGYWKWWNTTFGAGSVRLWESREAIAVSATDATGVESAGFIAGAIVDPESSDISVDAEADGKLYGVICSGGRGRIQSNFLTNNSVAIAGFPDIGRLLFDSDADGNFHAGIFAPGTSGIIRMNPLMTITSAVSPTSLKTRSGRYARMAFAMRSVTPDNTIGRLREICAFADGQMPATLTDGATTVGYLYGASTANLSDCLILEHS